MTFTTWVTIGVERLMHMTVSVHFFGFSEIIRKNRVVNTVRFGGSAITHSSTCIMGEGVTEKQFS